MKVGTVAQAGSLRRKAARKFGIDESLTLENSGEAVCQAINATVGVRGRVFALLVGGGDKGECGLVVARKLHSYGGEVEVLFLCAEKKFAGASKKNLASLARIGIPVSSGRSVESVRSFVDRCEILVDAILPTSLVGEDSGSSGRWIETVNASGKFVVSIDLPSGIDGDTGHPVGPAVESDLTVALGLPKPGNLLFPGHENCGRVFLSHLSLPLALLEDQSIETEINEPRKLPERPRDTHKGSFGEVLFIAGARGYLGAPYFAALSFLKAGGGYSRLATPESVSSFIGGKGSEIVMLPQRETEGGSIAFSNLDALVETSSRMDMVIVGPGLSLNEETQRLARELVSRIEKPLLIDGDGITAVSKDIDIIRRRKTPTILTPHLGEMSRMISRKVEEIRADRISILRRTARDLNAMIVLKGAHSQVGYPDGRVYIDLSGNSGMSTAGSGDVLTGTIAAMHGLGLSIEDSVRIGVFMHGFSGDLAAAEIGRDGMTAQDVLDYLPKALRTYREEFDRIAMNSYGKVVLL